MDGLDKNVYVTNFLHKHVVVGKVFVNCPVDIYVYQDENLVGLIKDDTPQEIENGIIIMMDDNGQKIIVLPGDSEYKLLCKATDNGTMTITTSCYEQTENLPTSVVSYYELPLQTGAVYEVFTTTSNFALKDVSGNSIVPSVFQSGADVKMYIYVRDFVSYCDCSWIRNWVSIALHFVLSVDSIGMGKYVNKKRGIIL